MSGIGTIFAIIFLRKPLGAGEINVIAAVGPHRGQALGEIGVRLCPTLVGRLDVEVSACKPTRYPSHYDCQAVYSRHVEHFAKSAFVGTFALPTLPFTSGFLAASRDDGETDRPIFEGVAEQIILW